MDTTNKTVIPVSKTKLLRALVGSIAFVAIGVWMLTLDRSDAQHLGRYRDITFLHFAGYLSIAFFGLGLIVIPRRLLDKTPGCIFDAAGISINAGGGSLMLIPWRDIVGAKIYNQRRQQFLVIELKDPQSYLAHGSWSNRALRNATYKMCGSPIAIPASTLKMTFKELSSTFDRYYRKYGAAPGLAPRL